MTPVVMFAPVFMSWSRGDLNAYDGLVRQNRNPPDAANVDAKNGTCAAGA